MFYYLHQLLIRWILNKYISLNGCKIKAVKWLRLYKVISKLILPLGIGLQTGLNYLDFYRLHNMSRMNREVQVRFCESFRGETPHYLLDCQELFSINLYHLFSIKYSLIIIHRIHLYIISASWHICKIYLLNNTILDFFFIYNLSIDTCH